MKKRICIVTNYSNTTNYGALLQAYALNYVLNEMGHIAKDLFYVQSLSNKKDKLLSQLLKLEFKSIYNEVKSRIDKVKVKNQLDERKEIMNEFRLSIPHTDKYDTERLKDISKEYDIFICGSDQIFRPNRNTGKLEPHYWLSMVDDTCIKASYAASIGIERYDRETENMAIDYLRSFRYISMRERNAAEYIKKITGRDDIAVSVDPVFLLNREEWTNFSSEYDIGEKYILVYMIHGTEKLYKSINDFAKEKRLKILTFPSMSYKYKKFEREFGDVKISNATPEQFISLIINAEYFFTDSFHGTAFSLILHKEAFVSRANELAFSRIENILKLFHAENLIIPSEGLSVASYSMKRNVNWELTDSAIQKQVKISNNYLRSIVES